MGGIIYRKSVQVYSGLWNYIGPQVGRYLGRIAFSVTSKKSPNASMKVAQNDFTRKMKDFDTFSKIA